MKISCLNISNPKLNRLANDFGEIKVSELMDKYYPNSIPTYEEFIANKSIKQELGVIPISKVKDEIGVSFKKEISNQQLINLKKAISKTNDKIKDFVYLLFNVKQIGQADLYTWGLRKVKGNLNIQAKLDRAVQQSTNTVQSNSKINNLQDRVNKDRIQGTLFGLNTQNQEKLEFHINTLNVIGQFLENVGVEQRLVPEFLSQEGNVVEGAIAAANFIQGTVDIIDDVEKRPSAWNKLPEEAAHWWYRLLDKNSELKDALLTSALTDRKEEELRNSLYGKTYNGVKVVGKLALDSNGNVTSKPALSAIREEAIGQLIAEAIKRIETQNGSAADYSFFKKFLEWINSIIDIFKNTTQDPFEVAAMKILSSDMSDLMTWEEYRKLNNIVNFADVLTEQSVAPIDYTLIEDLGSFQIEPIPVRSERGIIITEPRFTWYSSDRINKKDSPNFTSQEELDLWVFQNYGNLLEQRQKQILQEVRDNQIFFDRLLNKTFRKKSKFLPKTLRKYFDIIDAQNLNPLREWNISQELQQITKKLSEQEKKQIIETNGYTNIAPTLKVLPDLLQKYGRKTTPEIIKQEIEITNKLVKKEITKEQATELRQKLENKKKGNPIVLSEPIKIDGAKKQELSILNGIREMIKLENSNLKSITAEEFVAEAHNWLETNYLLGFANENSYLSYRTDQTFTYLKDRISNEDFQLGNMTEEEIQRLPFEERQRIANIVGLTKQNPDVYHNKVSIRFNDMYHNDYGQDANHFPKRPSAWGNLTYFYTGKNKWKDAVLLHEIQNDNIEALRNFKTEKVDLETSLGRYLQQLNTDLLDNITQIESGGKRIQKNDIFSTNPPRQHFQLNHQLQQLYNLPLEQGLNQLKQRLNEKIELYKSDNSVTNNPEKAQEEVEKAYSQRRKFADFQRKGGIKSLLSEQELQNLKDVLNELNTGTVMTDAVYMPDENQYEPGYETIRNLKQKKQDFKLRAKSLEQKINSELTKLYGTGFPVITLEAPVKPLPKSQRRNQIVGHGENRRVIGNASQELNENVNFLIAFSEQKINKQLSKNIEESKKIYIQARNATNAYNFNVRLAKITLEQWTNLVENYKYNEDLLNRLIDEQAQKDIQKQSTEVTEANPLISSQFYETINGLPLNTKEVKNEIHFGTWEFGYGDLYFDETYYYAELDNDKWAKIKKSDLKDAIIKSNTKEGRKKEQQTQFETLKQQALNKKAELEKNYGKIEEEVKQTLEIEMNYFTPLVHHLIQKHINQYGKDFPMYFSGYQITKLTQGNDRTAWIYAGKDEVNIVDRNNFEFDGKKYKKFYDGSIIKADLYLNSKGEILGSINEEKATQQEYDKAYQQATELKVKEIKYQAAQQIGIIPSISNGEKVSLEEGIKKLNEYKKQSRQNLDRVINTIMNISNNNPIETGAIYNAMSQISGVKLIWQDKIDGLQGNPGGYLVDLTNYNYNVPILYGLESKKQNNQNGQGVRYSINQTIKPGVEELFNENPELANSVYSKILTNSGLSAENLLSLLLKDNLIEKQCS